MTAASLRQNARDRLRAQLRTEQDLVARVLAADERLTTATRKRDQALAAHERLIAQRRTELADTLTNYLNQAGIELDRAAAVLGRDKAYLARLVREYRARGHRSAAECESTAADATAEGR